TIPIAGLYPLSGSLTVMSIPPPPAIEIEVLFTFPDGSKCYKKVSVILPPCEWQPQRQPQKQMKKTDSSHNERILTESSLTVYPNPADGRLSISYDYRSITGSRRILIYDALGRRQAALEA